jgi:hypothetical protein
MTNPIGCKRLKPYNTINRNPFACKKVAIQLSEDGKYLRVFNAY